MDRFGVQLALETLREVEAEWKAAFAKFTEQYKKAMTRLMFEAMANGMSIEQFAAESGATPAYVRALMRKKGLDPKRGRRFLAHAAAEALKQNAEALGIEPNQMDLRSPLAYLPGGSAIREQLDSEAVKGVKEV